MAEREKQAHNEFHGITPLQVTPSLSQSSVTGTHSTPTTVIPDPSIDTSIIMTASTTSPMTIFADGKETNLQFEVVEHKVPVVSHSVLSPGLQNINSQCSTTMYQSVSMSKESSVATGSFLFGPSDDGFTKDHNQLLCAADEAGSTISLPVRQPGFSDTNPLTPARNKICGSDYANQGTPLTPTANLKILLSAASPAIRERELMQQNARNVCRSILTDAAVTEGFEEYSRKQKSLSILCSRFVYICVD